MRRARILGTGSFVPDRIVTNAELCQSMDTSEEWIFERTGIRERRWISPGSGQGSADLGARAAELALADAGVRADQISLVIFATLSPDHDFPGNGVLLQRRLKIPAPMTLDIRQQCNGFIAGLSIADAFIRTGAHQYVLVVASEVQSTGLDLSDRGRDMSVIFADGAGAAVIGPSDDPARGILSTHIHVDGDHSQDLWCEFPSSKQSPRLTEDAVQNGRHYPRMQGRVVFKHAIQRMPEAVHEALHANKLHLSDLDLLVPHQANLRIIQGVQSALELPVDKVAINIERYGNTTSASIPLALDEARRSGRVKERSLVCLVAFGSGFTWGSALLRL